VLEGTYTCMLFHRPHRAIQQQGSFTYMLVDGGVCALSFLPSRWQRSAQATRRGRAPREGVWEGSL